MNFDQLDALDFSEFDSIADWTKLLNDLLGLAQAGGTADQLLALADKLDEFADKSSSEDLDAITKLDRIARRAARAIRLDDATNRIAELQGTSSDFQALAKELGAATAALRKETSTLRAEKFTTAITSLTDAISSLKHLADAVSSDDDSDLSKAITQAMSSAQKLRALLERPAS